MKERNGGERAWEPRHTTITTIPISNKKAALRHLSQIKLMQELAALSFLTQSSQPMLANQIIKVGIPVCSCMSVGTRCACWAVPLEIGFAYWAIGREPVAIVV